MSSPESSANIEFPASALQDPEIREYLEEYGVIFGPPPDHDQEVAAGGDLEVRIENGLFLLADGIARYGEFEDLEALLINKAIPFDRQSNMDWNREPVIRVFRPGDPPFDKEIDDGEGSRVVVKIRELLKGDPAEKETDLGVLAYKKTIAIMTYLDEIDPPHRPLADFVKEN